MGQQVFALNVGMLPDKRRHPIKRMMCEKTLLQTPGLLDFCETKGHGTLLFFATRPHAEKAREAMRKSGNPVEDAIILAIFDRENRIFHMMDILEE